VPASRSIGTHPSHLTWFVRQSAATRVEIVRPTRKPRFSIAADGC